MTHKATSLPEDYALVLQQVNEDGAEDFTTLAEALEVSESRLTHIIRVLKNKGLLFVQPTDYNDTLIEISARGKRMLSFMVQGVRTHCPLRRVLYYKVSTG